MKKRVNRRRNNPAASLLEVMKPLGTTIVGGKVSAVGSGVVSVDLKSVSLGDTTLPNLSFIGPTPSIGDNVWLLRTGSTYIAIVTDGYEHPVLPRSFGQNMGNKETFTSVSVWEQWGTDLVIPDPGQAVIVTAQAFGDALVAAGVNRSGKLRLEISLDNGSSWSTNNGHWFQIDDATGNERRQSISTGDHDSGTPTGDIRVRLMAYISGGAVTDMDYFNGHVLANVSPT